MPKEIVSFALSRKSIEKIDKASKALGMSRSALIELMIEKGFHFSKGVMDSLDEISRLQEKTMTKIRTRGS